ncbi:Protein spinster isoform X4 [Oopsacas minuta]|uniref:Protein spinster isoform X4 n=1 Tax=Oopsacas minuta TaxID=111878 RepID=A0AAV7JKP1_9METZ|nr:Protein spinster isoform X4 [Oopsacas minuta]
MTTLNDDDNCASEELIPKSNSHCPSRRNIHDCATFAILIFINALNYTDRWTVAAIITNLENATTNEFGYAISDLEAGFLTTSFILSFMVFSIPFGVLGDRYKRTWLMGIGLFIWSAATLAASFAPTYWFLLLMRTLVGIGEASYATIAPTIIADMFPPKLRIRMLSLFYLVIPFGTAFGFIVAAVAQIFAEHVLMLTTGQWRWALRITPPFGFIAVLLIIFVAKEPPRGRSEDVFNSSVSFVAKSNCKSVLMDIVSVITNYSFIFSTLGFTGVTFSTGALAQWAPRYTTLISDAYFDSIISANTCSIFFGVASGIGGLTGTLFGSELSKFISKYSGRADMYVCALGMLLSGPLLYLTLTVTVYSIWSGFPLVLLCVFVLSFNWAPNANILLYVVVPQRRSTAEAFQILISHMLGDAASPTIVGAISDWLRGTNEMATVRASALQTALYTTCFIACISGFFYLFGSLYVNKDKAAADQCNFEKVRKQRHDDSIRDLPSIPSNL